MTDAIADVIESTQEAVETLVGVKPSKALLIGLGVGGLALGLCVGWYLAGGLKLEQQYFNDVATDDDQPDEIVAVDVDETGEL